jgi:hypothetical protein
MTLFEGAKDLPFLVAWAVALGGWIYGTRYYFPWRYRRSRCPEGYGRKALIGYGIFAGTIVGVLLVAAAMGELAGG